jgi:purine-binding chemotaxis protein CheW
MTMKADIAEQDEMTVGSDESVKQFLTFSVEDKTYGVELMSIREIKGWTATTELPNSPSFMKGVINIRGIVIPIFDLRNRFDMGVTQPDEKNVVIIIAVGEKLIGILVDAVSDILSTNADQIKEAPKTSSTIDGDFVEGLISIEEKMVVILDVARLFDEEVLAEAEKASAQASIKEEKAPQKPDDDAGKKKKSKIKADKK